MYFHFTIGPVQGFVSQARRTRDFWAGSFILSWLSAVAMREVIAQHGDEPGCILNPSANETLLMWVDGRETGSGGPIQASVPNRFTAQVTSDQFSPAKVVKAVQDAWEALADCVRLKDLKGLAEPGSKTKKIWDQQITGFWEISWVLVADKSDTAALDRRKNLRNHMPPAEPGIKCMLMDGWQELSGAESPVHKKAELDSFWKGVREKEKKKDSSMQRDLREGEHLCSMAFVKRRFPRHFHDVSAKMPSGWTAKGWKVPTTVPSVVYMAAVPWLAQVIEKGTDEDLKRFHDSAKALTRVDIEWRVTDEAQTDIPRIQKSITGKAIPGLEYFRALEGGVFFDNYLEDSKQFEDNELARKEVLPALQRLRRNAGMGLPSPFYAVLRMDGDQMGVRLSVVGNQQIITKSLARFTESVPEIVRDHDGFLIYAGGDDVLALLPIDKALCCAHALHHSFEKSFRKSFDTEIATGKIPPESRFTATLSGAIEFAHMKMPLTRVLEDSHNLLDKVAKEATGRDSIACRVWKPGHRALQWNVPWGIAAPDGTVVLQKIVDQFSSLDERSPFSNSFFFRIRERLEVLQPDIRGASSLSAEQVLKVMVAEYLGSGINQGRRDADRITVEAATDTVSTLLRQCQEWVRIEHANDNPELKSKDRWTADGALLVKFLVQKGADR